MTITREQFAAWYDSLSKEDRIAVWYECTAMTREEVEQAMADGKAAREEVERWKEVAAGWELEARSLAADVVREDSLGRIGSRSEHLVTAAKRIKAT